MTSTMTAAPGATKDRILHLLEAGNLTEARPLCETLCGQANDSRAWRLLRSIAAWKDKLHPGRQIDKSSR